MVVVFRFGWEITDGIPSTSMMGRTSQLIGFNAMSAK